MATVRANTGAKWVRRAGSAAVEYEEGVKNPRASWAQSTIAAAPAQAAAVQAAIAEKRFERGVQKAGDAKWSEGATVKGTARFAGGVQASQAAYEAGVAPYLQAIAATQLPPRGPKGDPKNLERVRVLNQALRRVKTGR